MMSRKPYVAKQSSRWFLHNRFYTLYILRELTSIPIALYTLNLMCGLATFVTSESAWLQWVSAQTHPLMLIFAVIALTAALYHTVTWFQATPKILKIQLGEKFIPEKVILLAHWVGMIGAGVVLLVLVAYFS